MASVYYENLIQRVIDASISKDWKGSVQEWYIHSCDKDESQTSRCVCGKENLKYLFTIRNRFNGNILFPIGSSCILKFGRKDLKEQINLYEQMFTLLNAVEKGEYITLEYFSRKLLLYLYKCGVFKPTPYNKFNGKNDYDFMLDMFNKRNKPSEKQEKKIRGIIFLTIIPYLKEHIKHKDLFSININNSCKLV